MTMNPSDNMGIWLAILAVATALAGWNISRLRIVRPALDRLVALVGAAAIIAVVMGSSLVFTEVTECALTRDCNHWDLLLVAVTDVAVCAALITQWLRSDACRAVKQIVIPRTRRYRAVTAGR